MIRSLWVRIYCTRSQFVCFIERDRKWCSEFFLSSPKTKNVSSASFLTYLFGVKKTLHPSKCWLYNNDGTSGVKKKNTYLRLIVIFQLMKMSIIIFSNLQFLDAGCWCEQLICNLLILGSLREQLTISWFLDTYVSN